MKNKEGYPDPTVAQAIAHIRRQEKRRKREECHESKNTEMGTGAVKAASATGNGGKAV